MITDFDVTNILHKDSIKSLCRICLQNGPSVSLFKVEEHASLSEKVMLCARVEMRDGDGLPEWICFQCCQELYAADDFRIKCQNSDMLLRKFYLNNLIEIETRKLEDIIDVKIHSKDDSREITGTNVRLSNKVDKASLQGTIKVRNVSELIDQNINPILDSSLKIEVISEVDNIDIENNLSFIDDNNDDENYVSDELENKIKNEKYSCHLCNKSLKTKYTLEKHIQNIHSSEKIEKLTKVTGQGADRRFHCIECDYKSPYKKTLVCHMRTHTGEKPYHCDACGNSFAQQASLNAHKKRHSDKMYYTCAECGRQFKHKKVYDAHKRVHTKERKYVCSICSKALSTPTTLMDHMKRHLNIKNFNCEACGGVFVARSELINHMKVHNAERKYQCNFCGFKTYTKRKLVLHIQRHSGDRSFKCNLCEYSCYTSYDLKSHKRRHSKDKNYPCPECKQKFKHSSKVNRHMFKVHEKKFKWNDAVDRRTIK